MKRSALALVAVTLLAVLGLGFPIQAQTQNPPPGPARSRAEEMLERWNAIGNKLIAMAQDFPEDKYDFKVQKDQRTFALNLLHAAALDFVLIRRISGSNLGPDFGEGDNPTKFFGNRMAHNATIWTFAIEHSAEHYGQLVVYYRANNLVPPDSRR